MQNPSEAWRRLRGLRDSWRSRLRARRLAGRKLLEALAQVEPRAFFIVVGANDGGHGDHLAPMLRSRRARDWRGILVEPQDDAFARLSANYAADDRIALEHAAIAADDGRLPFYEMAPPADGTRCELVGPYDLLGSVSRDVLVGHPFIERADERITATEVDGIRFETLCDKHSVERLDLLLVDTEGYDFEVLAGVDLERWRPRLIVFEHALLSRLDRDRALALLRAAGYSVMEEFMDSWCLDARADDSLLELWGRLEPAIAGVSLHRDFDPSHREDRKNLDRGVPERRDCISG